MEWLKRPFKLSVKMLLATLLSGTDIELLFRRLYLGLNPGKKSVMYDLMTIEVMRKSLSKYSNCIDIGCHLGTKLRWMLRFAPQGKHFAFEPLPQLYQYLSHTYQGRKNVEVFNIALSDRVGDAAFYEVVQDPGYSGFRRRDFKERLKDVVKIEVKIDRLDNIISNNEPIDLIKVDVEGAEMHVFLGAIEIIKRCRPLIIFEHGLGGADYFGTTPDDIYSLLVNECGLKISLLKGWLKNGSNDQIQKPEFEDQYWNNTNFLYLAHP